MKQICCAIGSVCELEARVQAWDRHQRKWGRLDPFHSCKLTIIPVYIPESYSCFTFRKPDFRSIAALLVYFLAENCCWCLPKLENMSLAWSKCVPLRSCRHASSVSTVSILNPSPAQILCFFHLAKRENRIDVKKLNAVVPDPGNVLNFYRFQMVSFPLRNMALENLICLVPRHWYHVETGWRKNLVQTWCVTILTR